MLRSIRELNIEIFHLLNGLGQLKYISVVIEVVNSNFFLRIAVLIAPYLYFWFRYESTHVKKRLIIGMFSVMVRIIVARTMANSLPFENRPMFDASSGFRRPIIPTHLDMENWSSFPSDTAAVCIALPFSLLWVDKFYGFLLTLTSFTLFVIPRVVFGIHYPSDVFVGAILGAGTAGLLQSIIPDKPIIRITTYSFSHPQWFYPFSMWYLSASASMFPGIRFLKGFIVYLIKSVI